LAARTRSRDSFSARSGSPTIAKWGKPEDESVCTRTMYASIPEIAAEYASASIAAAFTRGVLAARALVH